MTDEQQVPDEHYFQMAVIHSLHRIYEVQIQIAKAAGIDQQTLEEMVKAHMDYDYEVPLTW